MKNVFLVSYKVRGIKNLEEEVYLSFYKKTITQPINTDDYNIKGIYGMNGSGKSGIVASVDILRNLIINENYLNNTIIQGNLDEIINKRTKELHIGAEFLVKINSSITHLYKYEISLVKNELGKFVIDSEELVLKTKWFGENNRTILKVEKGKITYIFDPTLEEKGIMFQESFKDKTKNLLSNSTASSLFLKLDISDKEFNALKSKYSYLEMNLWSLIKAAAALHVYMDQSDNHSDYILSNLLDKYVEANEITSTVENGNINLSQDIDRNILNIFSDGSDSILKKDFSKYEKNVERLQKFIRLFKRELKSIDIEKKEDGDMYICSLNMRYDETYIVNIEFESTGIKKLIKLFAYLQEIVRGRIVFIDELDSNLHDVYLCALLEYLMEYGQGQLCFTTHNVGPMDILKRHKKSIDFLSADNKIYSWKTNGNYSPSKLYRNGMIEGSPFNIDSIDFISSFYLPKEE